MKPKYLLFALLALGAQPALASAPPAREAKAATEPAMAVTSVRALELQRVADALTAEMGSKAGANTREAIEAMKARIKAMKRASPPGGAQDCGECPDKAV